MRVFKIRIASFKLICPNCGGYLEGKDFTEAAWPQNLTENCDECGTLLKIPHKQINKLFERKS